MTRRLFIFGLSTAAAAHAALASVKSQSSANGLAAEWDNFVVSVDKENPLLKAYNDDLVKYDPRRVVLPPEVRTVQRDRHVETLKACVVAHKEQTESLKNMIALEGKI